MAELQAHEKADEHASDTTENPNNGTLAHEDHDDVLIFIADGAQNGNLALLLADDNVQDIINTEGRDDENGPRNRIAYHILQLKDAQEAQFLKDNQAIWQSRHRTESNTPFSPNTVYEPDKLTDSQFSNHLVNAILVRIKPHTSADEVAESIRRWKHLTVYTRVQMENILIGKLIATSAKQISMFLVILAVVSAAIVAFIIYTLTMDKIREIAVLKLIGTRNRTIAAMILQQALALGVIGFAVGKITATFAAPLFPKYVLLIPTDSLIGFFAVLTICALASVIAIRIALQVDPAEAIGG